ncbi:hypothetical protein DV738_g4919, partial [Chaetothyriales sp. CBS 135597]
MVFNSLYPDLDIPQCNILTYLFGDGQNQPTTPLWIEAANPSHSLSVEQMLSWIKRLGSGLDKLGVPKAGAIMVFSPNHLYVPVAYLAAAGSQRLFTGANPSYTAHEVAHQIKTIEASILLVHPSLLKTGLAAAKEAGLSFDRVYQFAGEESQPSAEGIRDWTSILPSHSEAQSWKWDDLRGKPSTETTAAINFSSGTTGLPKGTCITHYNLVSNASQSIYLRLVGSPFSVQKPNPAERWLAFLPLYHAYSQLWTINIVCKLRVPVYVMAKFELVPFLSYIEKYKITSLQAVPPVLVMLAKRPETSKYDLSSINHILCGAAPLSQTLQRELSTKLGCVIGQGWGMTETTCVGTMSVGTVDQDNSGSIGQLTPNTQIKLIDDDGNEATGEGARGELVVRGPQIMKEYWRNEQVTRECKDAEGWFWTGDIALHRDGKFWIVDRKKELIKVNGLQVAPAELEAVLLEHEGIADAAAVGIVVHDEEIPRAYVVLQPHAKGKVNEKDVQDFVAKRVAKHKKLAGGVKFVDEIPKLASGKIIRKVMKEWAKRDLGLDLASKRRRRRSDYFYHLSFRLRWSDNDMFGHVNNPYYLVFVDSIVNQYLVEACGYKIQKNEGAAGIVANTYCDYFGSLHYPDVADVGLRVVKLGRTSVTYEVGIFRAGEDTVRVVGGSTHIWVDQRNGELGRPLKGGIPEPIRTGYLNLMAKDEGGTRETVGGGSDEIVAQKKKGDTKL